ncbi:MULTISPECIES: Crp/Fnr family transcriptional regulator [Sphingobium]|uniref:Crp/Fnr family transcriptional regulator n=1 Tax=Sphingobium tyrosinilyticum TaxID=2715436 RepID=A0ABV9ETE2_9SPHN|nr:Crp/Fnr family transcriptional regulator [Sphingobium sp. EP60837]ANI77479.1 Transcriptional activator protein Anr [Sphingobium sp. EP60837]
MVEPHLAKLRFRHLLTLEEEQAVRAIVPPGRTVLRNTAVVQEGERLEVSTLLLDGVMCRLKDLADGKRQITQIHVAGDFVDLHGFTLKRLEHDVMTLTDCTIALVPHEHIRQFIEKWPRLGRLYWFSTNLDACINREWELSLGQRSAVERLAALFCELHFRLKVVGRTGVSFNLGMSQSQLAESLGMTAVHVNRTLRLLRDRGLLNYRRGEAQILDLDGLKAVADFDDRYLYPHPDPL